VNVRATHWLKKDAKGNLSEVTKDHTVEIPSYAGGKVEELWVLRTADGGIEVVMSDVEPGHAQWPGKVKGWPEPSLAFQRERWELYRKQAEGYVSLYKDMLEALRNQKQAHLVEGWNYKKEREPDEIQHFTGPNDKNFEEHLRKTYVDGLRDAETELNQLLKEKP
jgi:hypothetical protein